MTSVTIREVAARAGVGVATVSRVLNGNPNVKEDTRQRVLKAVTDLNYIPNMAARQLSGGKSHVIGIVTPFFTVPSFSERLAGIQHVLWESAYDLVLYSVRSSEHMAQKLHMLLKQQRVDGMILLTPPRLDVNLWDANPNMPIVVVDSQDYIGRYPTVYVDNHEGGQTAAQYLIGKGHWRLGFIGDEVENSFGFSVTADRFAGFCAALDLHSIRKNPDWYRFGQMDSVIARRHAREVLTMGERPNAIFATSDVKAFEVINVAHELGLRVPHDLAVIGFDDITPARYMQLTTIRQHLFESGVRGARMMLNCLNGSDNLTTYRQSLRIIERLTT